MDRFGFAEETGVSCRQYTPGLPGPAARPSKFNRQNGHASRNHHYSRIRKKNESHPKQNHCAAHDKHDHSPNLPQAELRAFHAEHGIATEAWSPLAKGGVLDDPTVLRLASDHGKTPAQVVLRWHLELGNVVIPKSVTPERIEENFDVFDFELADDDMRALAELDANERTGPDPATFTG